MNAALKLVQTVKENDIVYAEMARDRREGVTA